MSEGTRRSWLSTYRIGPIVLLVLAVLALYATACGDSAPATSTSAVVIDETTTSPTPAGSSDTAAQPADGGTTETRTAEAASVLALGKDDFGHEVRLKVGERVRISLKPYVNDRIKSVKWDYVPIVVRETDSGAEVISDVVVEAWLELEAVVAGPVTVRAIYEYPYGTSRATWVAYLIVVEPQED